MIRLTKILPRGLRKVNVDPISLKCIRKNGFTEVKVGPFYRINVMEGLDEIEQLIKKEQK